MQPLKETVKFYGHYVKSYFRFKDYIHNYNAGIRLKGKDGKSTGTIVFLISFPESWNSVKSIYEEAVKNNNLKVYVVAVPQLSADNKNSENIEELNNESYSFFAEAGIEAIKANQQDGTWFDLKELNPDWVIYTRPYNQYNPELYRSYNVCTYSKVYYIPYAYSMLSDDMLFSVLPEDFIFTTRRVFLANDSRRIECQKKHPRYGKNAAKRFKYLGFPRFDLYKYDDLRQSSDKKELTIAWLPRWTTDSNGSKNKSSHFMQYYTKFIDFARSNPDCKIIIRPHPKMFSHYIANKIMTETELADFKDQCQQYGIEIDQKKDYIDTIKNSDILVSDYSSLVAEFYMTGKPIIFCDTVDGLNHEGRVICGSLYYADSFDEIVKRINMLRNGQDEDYEKRQQIIKELLPGKTGEIGKNILQEILNS